MINKLNKLLKYRLSDAEKNITIKLNEIIDYINNFSNPVILTSDIATINWNYQDGYNAELLLNSNKTIVISGLNKGAYGTLKLIQDNVGSRTVTIPLNSKVANGRNGVLSISSDANYIDIVTFYYDGVNFYWNTSLNFS